MDPNHKIQRILWIIGMLIYLQPINTTDMDRLLDFHLQLYQRHCGDVPACVNVTDSDNRTDYTMPIPCCPPCSCTSTCGIQKNSCPCLGEITDNAMTIVTRRDARQSEGKLTNNQSKNINEKFDGHDLTSDNPIILSRQIKTRDAAELEKDDTEKFDIRACIRPQTFYQPNHYIDSPAFLVIAKCIRTIRGTTTVRDCNDKHGKLTFYERIPITSTQTGLTYLNTFCLMCNEGTSVDYSIVKPWNVKIVYYTDFYHHQFIFHPLWLNKIFKTVYHGYSNIHYVPSSTISVEQCETYDVNSCNQTGLWENYDEMIENACHNGHSLPVLNRLPDSDGSLFTVRFKNIACIHYNAGSNFNEGSFNCGYFPVTKMHSYSLAINNKNDDIDESMNDLKHSHTYGSVLNLSKTNGCPSGYIALLGRCKRLMCPRDHYFNQKWCVPLYNSITGMKINLKISIHVQLTRSDVKSTNSSMIIEQLQNIVNDSLSRHVTLEHHEISVWYGPTRGKLSDKYYMFDIFLFNSSETIEYQTAVREIRAFYNNLQKYRTIVLSNDVERRIHIRFNHRLRYRWGTYTDISVDGGLRFLVGDEPSASIHRPAMMISDVNWCNRVVFKISVEAYRIGDMAYAIKRTNVKVFQHQYDVLGTDMTEEFMYLCVDLFTNYIVGEKIDSDITTEANERPYYEDNNENPVGDVKVSIIIVAVLAGLLAAATLCKFHYNQKALQTYEQDTRDGAGLDIDDGKTDDDDRPNIEMVNLGSDEKRIDSPKTVEEENNHG